jgi:hypothetical protein
MLGHPGGQAIGDRLGIPRLAGLPATLPHALMVGRGADRFSTQREGVLAALVESQ